MKIVDYLAIYNDYIRIADEHYHNYLDIDAQIEREKVDYPTKPTPLRQGFLELLSKLGKEGLIAVIFEALAVESFINYFAVSKLGDKYFSEHIEKLDVVSKYVITTELVTKKSFPKSNHIFGKLKLLVSLRNNLVHSKSIKFDYSSTFNILMDG